MKQAHPAQYQVEVVGTPDLPGTEYFVLDPVNDSEARYCLRFYVNALRRTGRKTRADELEAALDSTQDAHQRAMEAKAPNAKSPSARRRK